MIENCKMRHENGNCLPAGGFCTANKNICEALQQAYDMGRRNAIKELKEKEQIKGNLMNTTTTVSTKQSCVDDYNNRHLDMSDEKCNECECRYSCYFQMMAYNDVVEGN